MQDRPEGPGLQTKQTLTSAAVCVVSLGLRHGGTWSKSFPCFACVLPLTYCWT